MTTPEQRAWATSATKASIDYLKAYAQSEHMKITGVELNRPEEYDDELKEYRGVKITYNDRVGREL